MPADTPASLHDCWLPDTPVALSCLPALKQLLAPCLASAADSAGMSKSNQLQYASGPHARLKAATQETRRLQVSSFDKHHNMGFLPSRVAKPCAEKHSVGRLQKHVYLQHAAACKPQTLNPKTLKPPVQTPPKVPSELA